MKLEYKKSNDHNYPYAVGDKDNDHIIGLFRTEEAAQLFCKIPAMIDGLNVALPAMKPSDIRAKILIRLTDLRSKINLLIKKI